MSVQGQDRLMRKLANMPDKIRKATSAAIRQSADEIVAAQKRLAPVRTGKLRDSIAATMGGQAPKYASARSGASVSGDPDLTAVISAGNTAVRYAHLVEFGTAPHEVGGMFEGAQHPGSTPEPFFYPVYRAYRRRAKSRISRAMRKAIREAASS